MQDIFESFNPWWESKKVPRKIISRPRYEKLLGSLQGNKDIKILTGLRRVGKTTLMYVQIKKLIDSGVNPKYILFLSFDALALGSKSIFEHIIYYRKLHNIKKSEKVYLFLDEITYAKDFNQELKTLYDIGTYNITASSSSAKVLEDKRAFLTGRARFISVYPLDFEEFCIFEKKIIDKVSLREKQNLFERYLKFGGIPEYVLTKDPSYLAEITQMIIDKDIIAKHNLKQKQKVRELFVLLCERVGKQFTFSKISKILDLDSETVSSYIGYFLDTYLFEQIDTYGKVNQKIKGPKKLYCVDAGIRNSITGYRDLGAIYETVVYHKIRQFRPSYYQVKGIEIDFVFDNTILEAKFGQELSEEQQIVFEESPFSNKVIARGVSFFTKKQIFE